MAKTPEQTLTQQSVALESSNIPLGKEVSYPQTYDPSVLFAVARQLNRSELGIELEASQLGLNNGLPFFGNDLWTAYELSWLSENGKPQVAIAEFVFPCESPNIVESKSFKLYLNSFNQTRLKNRAELHQRLSQDLSAACGARVEVSLFSFQEYQQRGLAEFAGDCLDELDVSCSSYDYSPELLKGASNSDDSQQKYAVFSHLFKSNCLITGQPDWASVLIEYQGVSIEYAQILRYLVSFRSHNEFHEQCVERIFSDVMDYCRPEKLLVYARFTRRGGLDINPWRANYPKASMGNLTRIARQ